MYQVGRYSLFALLLSFTLSACSQNPAYVKNLGDHYYGFGSSKYSNENRSNYSRSATSKSEVSKSKAKRPRNYGTSKYVTVKVRRGDTVSEIAEKYNVSTKQIVRLNRLKNSNDIHVGQRLRVGKATHHVVKRGDTLKKIADRYGVHYKTLAKENRIRSPYTIHVGQKIRMPGAPKGTSLASASSSKKKYNRKSASKKKSTRTASRKIGNAPRFSWPVKGKVINGFGKKSGGVFNDGINIAAPEGSGVKAAAAGKVVYVGSELKSYGNLIIIQHENGWLTAYAHAKDVLVKRGDKIKKGQKIAKVGATGKVKSPQLHFAVRKGREAVNPANYLL